MTAAITRTRGFLAGIIALAGSASPICAQIHAGTPGEIQTGVRAPGRFPQAATPEDAIEWSPCPGPTPGVHFVECALVEMPLDHANPDGATMAIGIRRLLGAPPDGPEVESGTGRRVASGGRDPATSRSGGRRRSNSGRRQLWYLAGGPGDAVDGALGRLANLLDDPTLDLYGVDHRGTGGSGRLECPSEQAPRSRDGTEITGEEWADCIAHIESTRTDLDFLTVTQSAMDLGRIIERVALDAANPAAQATPGTPGTEGAPSDARPSVFIFGASFGTFWANRYLQLFPDQPTGVILDGIVPADWSFAEFDAGLDAAGRTWLARCAADETCGPHLAGDPAETAADMLRRLDEGSCPALGIDASTARLLLGVTLMVDAIPNGLIPVLIHRWDRCAWQDNMALLHFFKGVLSGIGEPASHSPVLQRHVALSELWGPEDPTAEELEAALAETVVTTDVSASFAKTYPDWPRYAPDPLDGHQADFAGPLLMLQGGLDPTMSVERLEALRTHFGGARQTFVVIPEAGHVVLNFSDCARSLYAQFLASPTTALDATCAGSESFIDFTIDPETARALLGTTDLWGDDEPVLSTAWFWFRYHWLPVLIGLAGLLLVARTAIRPSPTSGRRGGLSALGGRRPLVGLAIGGLVILGSYTLAASTPLLTDYRGLAATAAAFGIAGLEILAFWGLARWLGGGRTSPERP